MIVYKFNVGDKVLYEETEQCAITYRYLGSSADGCEQPRYVIRFCDNSEGADYSEDELEPIPSTPLDADGEEVGVGDLVMLQNPKHPIVGRVSVISGDGKIKGSCLNHTAKNCTGLPSFQWSSENVRILEKATPPQITLGSRVRVKATGREFSVFEGYEDCNGVNHWRALGDFRLQYPESELELIE